MSSFARASRTAAEFDLSGEMAFGWWRPLPVAADRPKAATTCLPRKRPSRAPATGNRHRKGIVDDALHAFGDSGLPSIHALGGALLSKALPFRLVREVCPAENTAPARSVPAPVLNESPAPKSPGGSRPHRLATQVRATGRLRPGLAHCRDAVAAWGLRGRQTAEATLPVSARQRFPPPPQYCRDGYPSGGCLAGLAESAPGAAAAPLELEWTRAGALGGHS
jgi:hypothetical protein